MARVSCGWPRVVRGNSGRARPLGAPQRVCLVPRPPGVLKLAETHLERLALIDGGRSGRVVDKMPDNYMYIGLLSIMFPRATFIHCRRDLRDIAVSCWMTDFRSIRWSNDQEQHRRAVPPVPPRDEPLEGSLARSHSQGEIRRYRHRAGTDGPPD